LARSIFDRDDDILIILGEFSNGTLALPSVRPKDGQSTQSNEKVAKIVANLNSVETPALKLNLKIGNASIKSLLKKLKIATTNHVLKLIIYVKM
jgi:hypothetical protein